MTAWDLNRAALRQHLKTDKIEDFLRWSTVEKTMFVGDVGFVRKEYEELMKLPSSVEIYPALSEIENGMVGNPKLLWGWTSGNLIHQLYHLKQWLDRSNKTVDQLESIIEVGAGYGAMALICRRLGFRGWYRIIDLPELIEIQKYYLHLTGKIGKTLWVGEDCGALKKTNDLLIACHSIGEMPIVVRERLLSQIDADAYLFASSYEFEGVDNETWLQQFAGGKIGYDWAQWAHPWQENALYQVGIII